MKYLLFDLTAPLQSWGSVTRATERVTDSVPTKSAILGLLAAAVGIDRSDYERKKTFDKCFNVAIAVETDGVTLKDYHTVQILSNYSGGRIRTRRDALEYRKDNAKLATVLTNRHYLQDASFTIAITQVEEGPFDLEALRKAILKPHFPIYLGRRCCPPAAPLNPRIVETDTLEEALGGEEKRYIRIHWEGCDSGLKADRVVSRRDNPVGAGLYTYRNENVMEVSR